MECLKLHLQTSLPERTLFVCVAMPHTIIMGTPQGQLLINVVPLLGLIRVLFHLGGEATLRYRFSWNQELSLMTIGVFSVSGGLSPKRKKTERCRVFGACRPEFNFGPRKVWWLSPWNRPSHQTFRVTTLNFSWKIPKIAIFQNRDMFQSIIVAIYVTFRECNICKMMSTERILVPWKGSTFWKPWCSSFMCNFGTRHYGM